MPPLWGIDLGGTKIEGIVLESSKQLFPLTRTRIPTEREHGYDHIISRILFLVEKMKSETGLAPERLGIGTPGTRDPSTGLMKNANTTSLNDRPLLEDLEQALGIPIVIANDANCFAIAETRLGAVHEKIPNAQVVFGVIMGTGVGGGVVINGKVLNGAQGIGGEWGHNFLDESGGPCYCGSSGCVETIISGPALEKFYLSVSGRSFPLYEIVQLHLDGTDMAATQTVQRLLQFFGKAISSVINILDPDAIVIGGGLGNIDFLYTEGVQMAEKFVFNNIMQTPFLRPSLGDSAGVFGAALLVAP